MFAYPFEGYWKDVGTIDSLWEANMDLLDPTTCRSARELDIAVNSLYVNELYPCVKKGVCASIYTQVSDVEDEINGLLTYDRKVEKLRPEVMLPIAEALQKACK